MLLLHRGGGGGGTWIFTPRQLGEREREGGWERENTLLHKDKNLSTSRFFFYKSVPDDKHGNTQYVKQEYK